MIGNFNKHLSKLMQLNVVQCCQSLFFRRILRFNPFQVRIRIKLRIQPPN